MRFIAPPGQGISPALSLGRFFFLLSLSLALGQTRAQAEDVAPVKIQVKAAPVTQAEYLKWELSTTVGDYDRAGRKNVKWDQPARAALSNQALIVVEDTNAPPQVWGDLIRFVQTAIDAGCDDPFIRYLHLRRSPSSARLSKTEVAERMEQIVRDAEGRPYSPIRRFFFTLRTAQALDRAWQEDYQPSYGGRAAKMVAATADNFRLMLEEPSTPSQSVITVLPEFLTLLKDRLEAMDKYRDPLLRPIFHHWPSNTLVRMNEAWFYKKYGWAARGNGPDSTVPKDGWRLWGERTQKAKQVLTKAWEMGPKNPAIPTEMISVLLSETHSRDQMETWFQRAMSLDPNNYAACKNKLWFLDPHWHGSRSALLGFGRECATNKTWGGEVPLTLIDAHHAIRDYHYRKEPDRSHYWLRPEVWPDIKASFDRFWEANPKDIEHHHANVLYAYRCQQWEELNRQLPLLGTTNYEYFDGREAFEKMVKEAQDHTGKQ